MTLHLYNTQSKKLEELVPQTPGKVRMYNCGPTVYSSPHIGNFRSFLVADLLRRYLEWRGFEVHQIMNLTDVGHLTNDEEESGEDKMEAASRREKKTAWQIAESYIEEFFAACQLLSLRPAHEYPRATDHIQEMQDMISALLERGYAYTTDQGNVYFEVSRFASYGNLSGNKSDDLLAGARIEVNPEKRDPRDFALWKTDDAHQMQWDSPWGRGFPGWHIECSAMSRKYLGDTLDIHTGGEDNIFPHHECEIAQSECANGQPFVRHWLHVRHLLVDGAKMSKRAGTFFTLQDLADKGYGGDAVRLALLKVHYREPLNFTFSVLDETQRKAERYRDLRDRLRKAAHGDAVSAETQEFLASARQRFQESMDDDMNVSVGLAVIDELVSEANRRNPQSGEAQAFLDQLLSLWDVFGLLEQEAEIQEMDPALQKLLDEREQARANKDFEASDRIRDEIRAAGFVIVDTPEGPQLKPA